MALILTVAVVAWVKVPDLYPPSTTKDTTLLAAEESSRSQAVTTTRASVLAALAGLGALVTIVINYRNSRANLRNAQTAIESLAVTNETLRLQQQGFAITQRGHLTDRYTRAIEQLGNSESIAIRLGGIYALEQIAVDTDRDGDQATVVEVLSAFFRNAVTDLATKEPTPAEPGPTEVAEVSPPPPTSPRTLPSDVLAALSVLSRLPARPGVDRADLGTAADGSYLSPALKPGANLTDANLTGANLAGAWLTGANLTRADLTDAHLTDAWLAGANLTGANLTDAWLTGANLTRADLTDAHLTDAWLTGANLTDADLTGARLAASVGLVPDQLTATQRSSAASLPPDWSQEPPPVE